PLYTKYGVKKTSVFLSGLNAGDDTTYHGSMGHDVKVELRNWYMPSMLRESSLLLAGYIICTLIMLGGFFIAMGGVLI
ncbi:MAG: hypothetical protein FWF22_06055, partial [Treponema sp.]|nr:hypothetical protein [Treponema sp.]